MLYKLGKVVFKTKSSIILESNYTGYIITVGNINQYEIDKFQKIYIYNYQNEYSKTIYGFKEFKERIFFEDLISVQGVGPKTAISILSTNWKEIMKMIAEGDYESIAKIPYVGTKTARKIVFDFQKKYNTFLSKNKESKNKLEVYKTLKTLGFNEKQINSISNKLQESDDVDQMIEQAIELISHDHQNKPNISKA